MIFAFNAAQGLIEVQVEVFGPSGSAIATIVNVAVLVALGYDPAQAPERLQVTTGSSIEIAPRIVVQKLVALGEECSDFPPLGAQVALHYRRGWGVGVGFLARSQVDH